MEPFPKCRCGCGATVLHQGHMHRDCHVRELTRERDKALEAVELLWRCLDPKKWTKQQALGFTQSTCIHEAFGALQREVMQSDPTGFIERVALQELAKAYNESGDKGNDQ